LAKHDGRVVSIVAAAPPGPAPSRPSRSRSKAPRSSTLYAGSDPRCDRRIHTRSGRRCGASAGA